MSKNRSHYLFILFLFYSSLAFASGANFNSTTQLPIVPNAAGNVGIGSANPGQTLDVQGSVRALNFIGSGSGLTNLTGANYWINDITGNVGISTIYAVGIGTTFVGGNGEGSLSVMNGNVGIGTWVPSSPLTVEGKISSVVPNVTAGMTAFEYNGVNEPGVYIETGNTASDTEPNFWFADPFSNNSHQVNTELGIATDVGLGDSNENDFFVEMLNGASAVVIASESENGNVAGHGWPLELSTLNDFAGGASGVGLYIGNTASQNIGIGTTNPQGGLVVMNGNVGVGTVMPSDLLEVIGTNSTGGTGMSVENRSNTGYTYLNFKNSSDAPVGTIGYGNSGCAGGGGCDPNETGNIFLESFGGSLDFEADNLYVMLAGNVGIGTNTPQGGFVVMNGNVGIGTWIPNAPLSVVAPPSASDETVGMFSANVATGSAAHLYINNTAGATNMSGEVSFASKGTPKWGVGNDWFGNGSQNFFISDFVTGLPRLFIDSSGNVGIGTWGMASALRVTGNVGFGAIDAWAPFTVAAAGNPVGGTMNQVGVVDDPTGSFGVWLGYDSTGTIGVVGSDMNGSTSILALATANSSGTPIERVWIDGFGNVGIGSLAPGRTLDVNGTARVTGFTLTGNGAGAGKVLTSDANGNGSWGAAGAGSNYWLLNGGSNVGINTTQAVGIGTSFVGGTGEDALSIMNGNVGIGTWVNYFGVGLSVMKGSVGIGTIGGDAALSISYNSSGTDAIHFTNTAVNGHQWAIGDSVGNPPGPGNFQISDDTLAADRIVINSSGNVGIGTIFPAGGLTIMNGNVGIGTWVPASPLNVNGYVQITAGQEYRFGGNNGTGVGSAGVVGQGYDLGSDFVGFVTQYVERARVDGNGNLGIGTTAPMGALTVMNGNVGIGTWAPSGALVVNGSVGIGTAVPQYLLHTFGSQVSFDESNSATFTSPNGNGPTTLQMENTDQTNSNSIGFKFRDGNATFAAIETVLLDHTIGAQSGNMTFTTINAGTKLEKMRITNIGNIGISSAFPGQMLDVQGTARALGVLVNGNIGVGTSLGGAAVTIGGSCAAHQGTGVCFGKSTTGITCLGYCTAGAWPNCTTCNCC